MDSKNLQQLKTGSLSSLRAGRILRPSPLANDGPAEPLAGESKINSTPENIRKLRSQKVYSSPSDNIMTPITRKLNKKHALAQSFMGKMDFQVDELGEENPGSTSGAANPEMGQDPDVSDESME